MQQATDDSKRRKSWHIRDAELNEAVKYCVMMRLTEKESLEELLQKGFDISGRTLRRIKKRLEPNRHRLDKIIKQDILSHIVNYSDTLKSLKERLLVMRKGSKNPFEELRIICEIRKTEKQIFDLYDSSPVIASLLNSEKKKDDVEEPA